MIIFLLKYTTWMQKIESNQKDDNIISRTCQQLKLFCNIIVTKKLTNQIKPHNYCKNCQETSLPIALSAVSEGVKLIQSPVSFIDIELGNDFKRGVHGKYRHT